MVELLRGGESVGQSTLTRFYSLHTFVMPWLLAVFMLMHFLMIRKQGISGPLHQHSYCSFNTRLTDAHP